MSALMVIALTHRHRIHDRRSVSGLDEGFIESTTPASEVFKRGSASPNAVVRDTGRRCLQVVDGLCRMATTIPGDRAAMESADSAIELLLGVSRSVGQASEQPDLTQHSQGPDLGNVGGCLYDSAISSTVWPGPLDSGPQLLNFKGIMENGIVAFSDDLQYTDNWASDYPSVPLGSAAEIFEGGPTVAREQFKEFEWLFDLLGTATQV